MAAPRFGPFNIAGQIFYKSKLSYGIVNIKPVVPGHGTAYLCYNGSFTLQITKIPDVLVIPHRPTPRFQDLTPSEVSDLFLSVQHIGSVLEKFHNAKSLTIAIQDGEFAGQSVPHVHVHLLPRVPHDFDPLDKVYDELDKTSIAKSQTSLEDGGHPEKASSTLPVDADATRKPRTKEDMTQEATTLAKYFPE